MTLRRVLFDVFQIMLAIIEWYALYLLLMMITEGSSLITMIILSIVALVCLFVTIRYMFSSHNNSLFEDDEESDKDIHYSYFEDTIQTYLINNGYDVKFKIQKALLNAPAYNVGKYIIFNKDSMNQYADDNGSMNMEFFWANISHELGHIVSGISKSKMFYNRPSSLLINYLRLFLNQMDQRSKKGFIYYLGSFIFFALSIINPYFLFYRNDEHYANKYASNTGAGINLLKSYMHMIGKKPMHDIYHPSVARMIKKMLPYYENYEQSDIYFENENLAYYPTKTNLNQLEELALNQDHKALYETGINLIKGNFQLQINEQEGLNRIIKAYELGNQKALRYLIYHQIDLVKPIDLKVDYTNELELQHIIENNLSEKIYLQVFNEEDLEDEENTNILFHAYKIGNKMGAKLYIEWLLGKYKYPLNAQEAYADIIKSYPFLDFSNEEWFSSINYINILIENYDSTLQPRKQDLKDKLFEDLKIDNQYVWSYTHLLLDIDNSPRFNAIFLEVIEEMFNEDSSIFDHINKSEIREFFKIRFNKLEDLS